MHCKQREKNNSFYFFYTINREKRKQKKNPILFIYLSIAQEFLIRPPTPLAKAIAPCPPSQGAVFRRLPRSPDLFRRSPKPPPSSARNSHCKALQSTGAAPGCWKQIPFLPPPPLTATSHGMQKDAARGAQKEESVSFFKILYL